MRLGICQLDPLVGALESNARRIVDAATRAAGAGADVIVAPELALLGYPPQDLLDQPGFVEACLRAADDLVAELGRAAGDTPVAFGCIQPAASSSGKRLANSVLLAAGGRRVARRDKTLLPSYDVFDEDRWFAPAASNEPVEHAGTRLGLTVCEDLWNDELFWGRRTYERDPVSDLARAGVDVLLNVSASPYHRGKAAARERMMAAAARRHGVPVLFVNQVGGNDELVFSGSSALIDANGRTTARAARFREDVEVVALDAAGAPSLDPEDGSAAELRQALVLGLRDYALKCGFRDALLGLSGGIDSAVVAALAVEALGADHVEGVLMPSRHSSEGSVRDSLELARRLGMTTRTIPIEPMHSAFLDSLSESFRGLAPDVTEENLQARIRGTLLMAISNKRGHLVLSTGNKSELSVGYCTLYGDMNGGLSVLGDCYKGWVRELARDVNRDAELIPQEILDKPPSAELRPDQTDQDELPPYELLDRIIEGLVERHAGVEELVAEGLPEEEVRRVRLLLDRNEYKRRQAPPVLRMTQKAFGTGRRLPIARGAFGS